MAFRLLFCSMLPLYFIFGTQYRCSSYFFRQKNRPALFTHGLFFCCSIDFFRPVSPLLMGDDRIRIKKIGEKIRTA